MWILSFFTLKLPEEAKKIEIFPKFLRWMKKTNIFKCKPPEVRFTIRNRVPYNKQLTNRACSGRIGEYWPSVVAVRTERTATTSGQYSPVRPSRSVSKRLLYQRYKGFNFSLSESLTVEVVILIFIDILTTIIIEQNLLFRRNAGGLC